MTDDDSIRDDLAKHAADYAALERRTKIFDLNMRIHTLEGVISTKYFSEADHKKAKAELLEVQTELKKLMEEQ